MKGRVCILTYENRNNLDYYNNLSKINSKYCDANKIDYIKSYKYHLDIPDYWIKVWYMNDLLDQYDYIMWLDSDAAISDFNFDIKKYFEEHPNILVAFSREPEHFDCNDLIESAKVFYEVNAGVILVKSTEKTKEFFKDWMNLFDKKKWFKEDGKWKCPSKFGGDDYEQGALCKLYKSSKWKDYLLGDDWQKFLDYGPGKDSYVMHFFGKSKNHHREGIEKIKKRNYKNDEKFDSYIRRNKLNTTYELMFIFTLIVIVSFLYFLKYKINYY
jgi:hypothetical protein